MGTSSLLLGIYVFLGVLLLSCRADNSSSLPRHHQTRILVFGKFHYHQQGFPKKAGVCAIEPYVLGNSREPSLSKGFSKEAKEDGLYSIGSYVLGSVRQLSSSEKGIVDLQKYTKVRLKERLNAALGVVRYGCPNVDCIVLIWSNIFGIQFTLDSNTFKNQMQNFTRIVSELVKILQLSEALGGPVVMNQTECVIEAGPFGAEYIGWATKWVIWKMRWITYSKENTTVNLVINASGSQCMQQYVPTIQPKCSGSHRMLVNLCRDGSTATYPSFSVNSETHTINIFVYGSYLGSKNRLEVGCSLGVEGYIYKNMVLLLRKTYLIQIHVQSSLNAQMTPTFLASIKNAFPPKISDESMEPHILPFASWDGEVYGLDINSEQVKWAFSTGSSLASHKINYKDVIAQKRGGMDHLKIEPDQFLFFDLNFNLRVYDKLTGIQFLPKSPIKYMEKTPYNTPEGFHIIAMTRMTTFFVDYQTGVVLYTFESMFLQSDFSVHSMPGISSLKDIVRITRTDFTFIAYDEKTGRLGWIVSIAEIDSIFIIQTVKKLSQFVTRKSKVAVVCQNTSVGVRQMLRECINMPAVLCPPPSMLLKAFQLKKGSLHAPEEDDNVHFHSSLFSWSTAITIYTIIVVCLLVFVILKSFTNAALRDKPSNLRANNSEIEQPGINQTLEGVDTDGDIRKRINNETVREAEVSKKFSSAFHISNEVAVDSDRNGIQIYIGEYIKLETVRDVAIKRFTNEQKELASNEYSNLSIVDNHPNIARAFCLETNDENGNISLALELYACNLYDLIYKKDGLEKKLIKLPDDGLEEKLIKLPDDGLEEKLIKLPDDLCTVKTFPFQRLLNLMRDMATGLSHLHALRFIHMDMQPRNIWICERLPDGFNAKISNMGSSIQFLENNGSTTEQKVPASGWHAPEVLQEPSHITSAMDIFSLGCIFFFCITNGFHPFYSLKPFQDASEDTIIKAIKKGQIDLFLIEDMPEAHDLINKLLCLSSEKRPSAKDILLHPLFWNAEKRLKFIAEVNEHLNGGKLPDLEAKVENIPTLSAKGRGTKVHCWKWLIDDCLFEFDENNLSPPKHSFKETVCCLLRFIRNIYIHFPKMEQDLKKRFGLHCEKDLADYFASRFPTLLIHVYRVAYEELSEEKTFDKYFRHVGC